MFPLWPSFHVCRIRKQATQASAQEIHRERAICHFAGSTPPVSTGGALGRQGSGGPGSPWLWGQARRQTSGMQPGSRSRPRVGVGAPVDFGGCLHSRFGSAAEFASVQTWNLEQQPRQQQFPSRCGVCTRAGSGDDAGPGEKRPRCAQGWRGEADAGDEPRPPPVSRAAAGLPGAHGHRTAARGPPCAQTSLDLYGDDKGSSGALSATLRSGCSHVRRFFSLR